jgi:predicted nucleic acid-binding protein
VSVRLPRPLVADTNVVLKFYLPEEGHEEALKLLEATDAGAVELLAPGTILPEGYNAMTQQQRRGLLDAEDAREAWEKLLRVPVYTYAIEDLIERAGELARDTNAIVYDALFLALAEDAETVVITADAKLLKTLQNTAYSSLAQPLSGVDVLLH